MMMGLIKKIQKSSGASSRSAVPPVTSSLSDNNDDFDDNSWLHSIHKNMSILPVSHSTLENKFLIACDDSLPPLSAQNLLTASLRPTGDKNGEPIATSRTGAASSSRSCDSAPPTGFAEVGMNQHGNVLVSWLDPFFRKHWVNIAAVMNRGVYCVTESCPLSKAYTLFTSLGLRHIVVLGGSSGGEVVGIFSRANLLQANVEIRTGAQLY